MTEDASTNAERQHEGTTAAPEQETPEQQTEEKGAAYRTQEDFDAAFERRMNRERKKLRQELQQEADEKARRERMDETERLKLEREEADKRAKAAAERANARVVKAEAKAQAATLGVPANRLGYVLKLADLAGVDVDEETGEADEAGAKAAIEAVLADVPELAGRANNEEAPQPHRRAPDATRHAAGSPSSDDVFNDVLRARGLAGAT